MAPNLRQATNELGAKTTYNRFWNKSWVCGELMADSRWLIDYGVECRTKRSSAWHFASKA